MTVRRRLLIFLTLLLPITAALFAGLARAWRSGGQADPWNWALPAALMLALMGQLLSRYRWPMLIWVAVGTTGTVLLFCATASARAPSATAAAGLLVATLGAGLGSRALHQRQTRLTGAALLLIAVLTVWRGPSQPIAPAPDRPRLAVISALSLFWDETGRNGRADAPIVTLLRTRFTVQPLDDPRTLASSGAHRLLLAQPRTMAADQLVAIDQWVRAGGTAVVLADPLLRWPSALPMGDRRRAPSAHGLEPLLAHWGFERSGVSERELRHFMPDGRLLVLSGTQADPAGVPSIAVRRIGGGTVRLVGDADLLDDRLWLARPERPLDPRAWSADTPALLVQWLGGTGIEGRYWMRIVPDVIRALRWALLFGTGWALLAMLVVEREFGFLGRNKS